MLSGQLKKLVIVAVILVTGLVIWSQRSVLQRTQHTAIPLTYPEEPPPVPAHQPLTKDQTVQYENQKVHLENKMKKLMEEFNNNLSDRDVRARLEAEMKIQSEEYKKIMLKLGKDALEKANKDSPSNTKQ